MPAPFTPAQAVLIDARGATQEDVERLRGRAGVNGVLKGYRPGVMAERARWLTRFKAMGRRVSAGEPLRLNPWPRR